MSRLLQPEQMRAALAGISSWRQDDCKPVDCPACGTPGLTVVDQSSRPHAEWYALSCSACHLDTLVQIPLGLQM